MTQQYLPLNVRSKKMDVLLMIFLATLIVGMIVGACYLFIWWDEVVRWWKSN